MRASCDRDAMRADGDRRARARSATPTSRPTPRRRALAGRASSSSRSRARSRSGCRVLVLDEPTSSLGARRCAAAVRADRAAEAQGHRDRLHLALHRRSEGGLRSRSSCCATAGTPATGITADDAPPTRSSSLMVGRAVDDLYPRAPRARRRGHARGRRASAPGRRRSRCTAARSSASPACSAPAARGCCARIFGLEPVRSGRDHGSALLRAAPRPTQRWRAGHGDAQRGSRGRRARARPERRRQPDAVAARRPRARVRSCCRRAQDAAARRWIERLAIRCAQPAPAGRGAVRRQSAEGRGRAAAASRRRRAAARRADARHRRRRARRRSTRCIDALVSRIATRAGRRRVLLVSSYLPELLGLCDRIAVMRAAGWTRRGRRRRVDRARAADGRVRRASAVVSARRAARRARRAASASCSCRSLFGAARRSAVLPRRQPRADGAPDRDRLRRPRSA